MENEKDQHNGYGVPSLCFSMNSLDGYSGKVYLDSPNNSALTEITTNSLNRRPKRKANHNLVRRSWGPKDKDEANNEFWASIQEPYNFIMGTNLMPESVQPFQRSEFSTNSVEMELSWDFDDISPSYGWDFSQFMDQYNELYEWLIEVQVNSQSSLASKEARLACQAELDNNVYRKKLFLEQGNLVAGKYPTHNEEISWRVSYLQNKWDQLESAFGPRKLWCQDDVILDIDHEETVVKRWLETMEGHIQPITCRLPKGCSMNTLQERFKDNQILLKDITAHGPVLKSILRHYEKQASPVPAYTSSTPVATPNAKKPRIPRKARSLEKRWHQIYLRSLEWHYYLEGAIENFKEYTTSCSSESDDEPLAKCRRLSSSYSSVASDYRKRKSWTDYDSYQSENGSYIEDDYVRVGSGGHSPRLNEFDEPMVTDVVEDPTENVSSNLILNEKMEKSRSRLTAMEMTSPNSGVYDFKHHDTDSEGNKSPHVNRKIEISRAQKIISMKSVKYRTSTLFEYDEEEQEKILQQIIDSAVLDPDWLKNNVATDSEASEPENVDNNASEDSGSHDLDVSPKRIITDKDSLRKLISDAEKLVKEKRGSLKLPLLSGSNSTKQHRIRQWLAAQRELSGTVLDSCDASGELTTGESDCESNTSDKGFGSKENGSLLSSENTPVTEVPPSLSSTASKVILRGKKRRQSGQRPWSISELHQLPMAQSPQELRFLRHCLGNNAVLGSASHRKGLCSSESALNHLQSPVNTTKGSSLTSLFNTTGQVSESDALTPGQKTDSTPTFDDVDASNTLHDSTSGSIKYRVTGTGSLKKRKSKLRRKSYQSMSRRTNTDSGSEGFVNPLDLNSAHRRSMAKSSSGSEDILGSVSSKRSSIISDPSPINAQEIPDISVTEDGVVPDAIPNHISEEDSLPSPRPFMLGPITPRDSDIVTTHEEFSSLSEQAWDPYQDQKYLSEPYSEDIDQDAARKLLDFGDDYRKYIDSDGSSFFGGRQRPVHLKKNRNYESTTDLDSETEVDSLRQVIEESKSQLAINENILKKYANETPCGIDLQSEVISTAQTNLMCLRQFVEALQKEGPSLNPELKQVEEPLIDPENLLSPIKLRKKRSQRRRLTNNGGDLIQKWETLKAEAELRQRQATEMRDLELLMSSLQQALKHIDSQCESLSQLKENETAELLNEKLTKATSLAKELDVKREELISLNINIHRYLSDSKEVTTTLKDDLTELYRQWDIIHKKASSEVSRIEAAQSTWAIWQAETARLKEALKQDSDTLKVLDQAIQTGDLTEAMTSNAQGVAKLLNERRKQNMATGNHKNSPNDKSMSTNSETSLQSGLKRVEDIFSDSGTSGYESCSSDDLSEREKRLAHLKKLAKELEATLVPGSRAWTEIMKTLTDAENDLHNLQQQCRELFVRTAVSLEEEQIVHPINGTRRKSWSKESKPRKLERRGSLRSKRNLAWRVVKASIPFQAILLLLLWVACFLEPNCCDSINTLNLNMNPQLRFLYGPPPI